MFRTLALTLDFDPAAPASLGRLIAALGPRSALLRPGSRVEALVLVRAFQGAGRLWEAQILLSDIRGRYGFTGNRLALLLQAESARLLFETGEIPEAAARRIREGCMAGLAAPLSPPRPIAWGLRAAARLPRRPPSAGQTDTGQTERGQTGGGQTDGGQHDGGLWDRGQTDGGQTEGTHAPGGHAPARQASAPQDPVLPAPVLLAPVPQAPSALAPSAPVPADPAAVAPPPALPPAPAPAFLAPHRPGGWLRLRLSVPPGGYHRLVFRADPDVVRTPFRMAAPPQPRRRPVTLTLDRIEHALRWRMRRLMRLMRLGKAEVRTIARHRLAANRPAGREARATRSRSSLFPGIALDLEELRAQITAEKGGPLLAVLQARCLELPALLAAPWPVARPEAIPEAVEAMALQNLRGGRRRDLPLTPQEAWETVNNTLALTLDFDPAPPAFLSRLFATLGERSALLAPRTKEETLILAEAFQAVGALDQAGLVIADAFGRYGTDGDREMLCLEANNARLRARAGQIPDAAAERIRAEAIGEIFGRLARPGFPWNRLAIDSIATPATPAEGHMPLASVILTVYNGAATLPYALDSLLAQTWRAIEVIAVDDASTDDTGRILTRAAARDPRIKLFRSERSLGAYGARNFALRHVTGETVTCHDADDWSHPQKIERQMRFLYDNANMVACSSAWIRVTEDLEFTRKSRHHRYVQRNPSSIMFRRTALARTGDWDEVTIGADTEFEERIKLVYGPRNLRYLDEVLSFGLDHARSLSKEAVWRGWLSSDLDTYHRAFGHWHAEVARGARKGEKLAVAPRDAEGARAFPAPARMLRQPHPARFDVVMMSDLRLYGGSVLSVAEEIRAQHAAGLTTAIHQINCVSENITGRKSFNPEINRLLHEGACTLVGEDWAFAADVCLMRFPPVFDFAPARVPEVAARHHILAVNTAPVEPNGEGRMYHVDRVIANMTATFGHPGIWAPIGPRIRDYIRDEVPPAILAPEDWVNIVDVEGWTERRTGFLGERPVVGRHSRDDKVKWPRDAGTIREVYLSDPGWALRIMGGAGVVTDLVGPLPENVTVLGFNALPVRDFLRGIDFFVYYDDPERVEAFGRVFIEAIAAGACVILPPYYRPVFGEACLYAEPHEVRDLVNRMHGDPEGFVAFVSRAQDIARIRWSYAAHVRRIRALQA